MDVKGSKCPTSGSVPFGYLSASFLLGARCTSATVTSTRSAPHQHTGTNITSSSVGSITLLTHTLAPYQSGGVGGPDVASLLLSYDLEFPVENFGFVAALDFAKAFDSCDTSLVLRILSKIGLPNKIVRILADQWTQHNKWVTFANSVCPQPLSFARGLPEGDPWSPIGMSLVLMLAMLAEQRADQLVPEARSLLYLDDRTILAPNPTILRHALDAWDALYQCTRLKNRLDAPLCSILWLVKGSLPPPLSRFWVLLWDLVPAKSLSWGSTCR